MSQDARRARRAGKAVLQLYREHDPRAKDIAVEARISCKEGCAHCCQLPATATIPEMVLVVEHLIARTDWPQRRPQLERELTQQLKAFVGVDVRVSSERDAFFQRRLPCVFLTKSQRCEIYAVRPTVCRYHMVVSPAENCAPGAENATVALVNLKKTEDTISIGAAEVFGELTGGPIALAFVYAARMLDVTLAIDPDLVRRGAMIRIPMDRRRGYAGAPPVDRR